ncbi:ABC transporter ATP-binding protein [Dictyobacter arantiisoli]|uniref:Multidrug ABC transporter ATP-binding protein n=1 Tax=Dictyobacter arantiisoli TaxID=2014874 RepID=A0A5A5TIR9_9CHLR|nr:ABC transporter ATP-binding protein [Dictyobacter arantiisoli]GCF11307.1 multidrug ABC transporter ATP-binding protein [Dictyobacter arantiisoli]
MDVIIKQLNKIYHGNVHALQNLTLTIPSGMFGLLGPNGAGKTTLMRTLAGILHPSSGQIQVGPYDGTSEQGRLAIQQTLGYLPQEVGLYPDLSAREFLDYIGLLKGLDDDRTRKQRVEELLEMVALQQVAQRKIKTYSGGMKRRVGIAQALLNDPRLLIVDEPTAGLDPEERIRFRNLLSDLAGERTILLSTHIVEDIAQTCQNIALMQKGQVIFQGTIQQLLQQTQGKVWLLTTNGTRPGSNCTIVSTLHLGTSVQYRVVGTPGADEQAVATEPSLEDSYVWFMHHQAMPVA